jgi:regulation of enolase protein 1 (concanavalin A-like superfamily)
MTAMRWRSYLLTAILTAAGTTTAVSEEPEIRPSEIGGWGRLVDPWGDCNATLSGGAERLTIRVPETPHVLSAEVPNMPMNAPRVVRQVRGDFTAVVHVLGRFEPGRDRTTHYNPYHGAGLIVWQDPGNYLRLERAVGFINGRDQPYVNDEWREGGRLAVSRGHAIPGGPIHLKLRRHGPEFTAWYSPDGLRWHQLGRIRTFFSDRVEAGVIAVNSSGRPLSADLEMLSIVTAPDSTVRVDVGRTREGASRPPPASLGDPPARPGRVSMLFDPGAARKPLAPPSATNAESPGFHW